MSESYIEYLVKRKTNPAKVALKYILFGLAGFFVITGLVGSFFNLLIGALFVIIAYVANLNLSIEYEYLFLEKELSIDKIQAQTRRRKVKTYDITKMELLAPVSSHRLDSYRNNKKYGVKDYSSHGEEATAYAFVYSDAGVSELVIIDVNDSLLKCFKNVSPRKVFTD